MIPEGPVTIEVAGKPATKGSYRMMIGKGKLLGASKQLDGWVACVKYAALEKWGPTPLPREAAVNVSAAFGIVRPKKHYRKNGTLLREDSPIAPSGAPDVDKLGRAILDALEGVIYQNDSQVTNLTMRKEYRETPGATIIVDWHGNGVTGK